MDAFRRDLAMATAHGVGAMAAIVASLRTPATCPVPSPDGRSSACTPRDGRRPALSGRASSSGASTHALLRVRDGRPAIDTYLVAVAPPPDERFERRRDPREPAERERGRRNARRSHGRGRRRRRAADPRVRGARGRSTCGTSATAGTSQWPTTAGPATTTARWGLLVPALLDGIDRWSVGAGAAPRTNPGSPRPGGARRHRRDDLGNALAGVRTAWVDVPSARYLPRCECSPVVGEMRPFDAGALAAGTRRPRRARSRLGRRGATHGSARLAPPRRRRPRSPRPPE